MLEEENRETTSPSGAAVGGATGGAVGGVASGERVHRCGSCAYTSTYRGNVVRHARLVHATEEPDPEENTASLPATLPTLDIKKEPENDIEETPNHCKSCDISFKYVNTFNAHKQFYCPAAKSRAQDSPANNNVPAPPPARVTDTPVL